MQAWHVRPRLFYFFWGVDCWAGDQLPIKGETRGLLRADQLSIEGVNVRFFLREIFNEIRGIQSSKEDFFASKKNLTGDCCACYCYH